MSTTAQGPRLTLGGWLAAVVAAVVVLHAAGSGPLATPATWSPEAWTAWVAERDPVVAALAIFRLAALAVAWYVLVMTVAGTVLRLVAAGRLVRVVDRLTVPALRQLLVGAAGLSLASGISPALAFASASGAGVGPTTTTTSAAESRPPPTLTMRLLPPGGEAEASAVPEPTAPAEVAPPAVVDATPATWTVRPGECFWSIAEDVLTEAWGRPPTDGEIVPYWHRLIEANRSTLADRGNPDLVYAEQVFVVPTP
jgi:hypothetical protein